jgi:nicotinamidase-related amidase
MDALLVIDMQEGLLRGEPKHDLDGVIRRINIVANRVRQGGGVVFFVQHAGPAGDDFEPLTAGWRLLSSLAVERSDRVVSKKLNDAFRGTSLQSDLAALRVSRVIVAGWATDLCVDATVRSAAALGYEVRVAADCQRSSSPRCAADHRASPLGLDKPAGADARDRRACCRALRSDDGPSSGERS